MHPATENLSITKSTTTKKLDPRNTKKKNRTHEILTRKILGSQSICEKKLWTHEYPRENILDPRNTHEKTFRANKYPREKYQTYEIPTRENFVLTKYYKRKIGPTKYLRMHDRTIVLNPQDLR